MPSYHEQLLEANPGSFITLERTATNQFHRLFLCYYASAKFASRAKRGEYDEELIMEQLALNRSFLGDEELGRIWKGFVIVVGAGGVGSWAATMLARSGIGLLSFGMGHQLTLGKGNFKSLTLIKSHFHP